ncbi:MAG: hypothetical protein ABIG11_00540 [bacterium]
MHSFLLPLIFLFSAAPQLQAKNIAVFQTDFDPPTETDAAMLKEIIRTKNPDKLYVSVPFLCSGDCHAGLIERVGMLGIALKSSKLNARMEVLETGIQGLYPFIEKQMKIGDTVTIYVPEGSPLRETLPDTASTVTVKTNLCSKNETGSLCMNVPNVCIQSGFSVREKDAACLDPAVNAYVKEFGLYEILPEPLLSLQRKISTDSFLKYISQLKSLFPSLSFDTAKPPEFNPKDSNLGTTDRFIRVAIAATGLRNEKAEDLCQVSVNQLLVKFADPNPYSKLPFIQYYPSPDMPKPPAKAPIEITLPKYAQSDSEYIMNVEMYVSDRFARPLRGFIKANSCPIYIHSGTVKETLAWQRAENFSKPYIVRMEGRKMFLLENPHTGKFRLVLSDISGEIRQNHVKSLLGYFSDKALVVENKKQQLRYQLSGGKKNFRLADDAAVVFGFNSYIKRAFAGRGGWSCEPLTDYGIELDLCTSAKSGRQAVLTSGLYGDDITSLLELFYPRGARNFIFLGKAGGMDPSMSVGDIVLPATVATAGLKYSMVNRAWDILADTAAFSDVKNGTSHGWVNTIMEETLEKLKAIRAAGTQSIDIEVKFFARYFKDKKDAKTAIILFITDLPLSEETIEKADANGHLVYKSITRVITALTDEFEKNKQQP